MVPGVTTASKARSHRRDARGVDVGVGRATLENGGAVPVEASTAWRGGEGVAAEMWGEMAVEEEF